MTSVAGEFCFQGNPGWCKLYSVARSYTWLLLYSKQDFERPFDFLRFCNFPARCGLSKSYVCSCKGCFTMFYHHAHGFRPRYTLRWGLCWDRVPMRCQGKFLVGCDGGRSNVRCGVRIRWPLDSLGSGWDDYTLKRKVIDFVWWWFQWCTHPSEFIPNSFFGGKRMVPFD